MTLIAVHTEPMYYAVSDALLSTNHAEYGYNAFLPIPGKISPHGKSRLYGVMQKAVIIDPGQLLMWSGDYRIAYNIIAQYFDDVQLNSQTSFQSFLELNFEPSEYLETSFIHSLRDPVGIRTDGINIKEENVNGKLVTAAGSGLVDFFNGSSITSSNSHDPKLQMRYEVVGRVMHSILSEAFAFLAPFPSTIVARYGGWWELTYATKSGFEKTPYLVKFWTIEDGKLKGIKGYQCWYEGANLKVIVYQKRSDSAATKVYDIPDMLGRDPPSTNEIPQQSPHLQLHILITEDDKKIGHVVTEGYRVSFDGQSFQEDLSDEFIRQMLNTTNLSDYMYLKRNW